MNRSVEDAKAEIEELGLTRFYNYFIRTDASIF
jgi:hypothetical protein